MQQFRQRVIASYHLGPLDREETQGYIEHRLKHVGWKADPEIRSDAHDAIFAFTAGIPRRINLVCNRLMLAGFLGELHVLKAHDVEMVVSEIKDELGIVSSDTLIVQTDTTGERENVTSPGNSARVVPASQRDVSERTAEHIEVRLTRLENTLLAVLNALKRILHVVETSEKKTDRFAS